MAASSHDLRCRVKTLLVAFAQTCTAKVETLWAEQVYGLSSHLILLGWLDTHDSVGAVARIFRGSWRCNSCVRDISQHACMLGMI